MTTDNNQNLKTVICCRIPLQLKEQIQEFKVKYHIKTETECVIELLEIALTVDSMKDRLKDPEVVQYMK